MIVIILILRPESRFRVMKLTTIRDSSGFARKIRLGLKTTRTTGFFPPSTTWRTSYNTFYLIQLIFWRVPRPEIIQIYLLASVYICLAVSVRLWNYYAELKMLLLLLSDARAPNPVDVSNIWLFLNFFIKSIKKVHIYNTVTAWVNF